MIRKHWPLLIPLAVYWAILVGYVGLSLSLNQGHWVYPTDDTYIHMAMAKNLSQHGVWGIDKYGFTSSSSSLLWTSMVGAVFFIFGIQNLGPLILNVIFGTLVCIFIYFLLGRYKIKGGRAFGVLLLAVFLTPLPFLTACGLEHTLQILVDILFVSVAALVLSQKETPTLRWFGLFLLAPVVVMVRYEGLFLVIVIGCLFLIRREYRAALLLGVMGVFPVVVYGWISMSEGWFFLPNSILSKGNFPDLSSWGNGIRYLGYFGFQLAQGKNLHVLIIILCVALGVYLQYREHKTFWTGPGIMGAALLGVAIMHMQFARTELFYRYEAYLVTWGIVVAAILIPEGLLDKLKIIKSKIIGFSIVAAMVVFVLLPLIVRGAGALVSVPRASNNIYSQQYQMGLFLRRNYQNRVVAVNDIGAVNYLADIRCVDLWGLADRDILKLKRGGRFHTSDIYDLTKKKRVCIAMVYENWFKVGGFGGIPLQWVQAGKWKLKDNLVCGDDTVTFYAVDPSEIKQLIINLGDFSGYLPPGIVESGEYTRNSSENLWN